MVVRFREARNLFDKTSVLFTATKNGRMPTVREDQKLVQIRFRTCADAQLVIFVCYVNQGGHDRTTGIPNDAWYIIRSPGIPDRLIRIFSGAEGLHDMLLRYAFQDSQGCKHEKHMQLEYAREYQLDDNVVSRVIPKVLTDALGIPQFYKQSGNCWFASMCWVLFGNDEIRKFVCDCFQRAGAQDLARWAQRAFHEPDTAQMIRNKLWRDHRIGDDVDAAPHLDGQNGGSEMIRVCDAYNIPLRILQCEAGTRIRELRSVQPGKKHIMLVRAQDKNHTTEMPLRRYYGDKAGSYRLVSGLLGQRQCGHQQGFANVRKDCWAVTDSDAHKMFKKTSEGWRRVPNMSPLYFDLQDQRPKDFADVFKFMVFVTKYGNEYENYCNFSLGVDNNELSRTNGIVCADPSTVPLRASGALKRDIKRNSSCTGTLTTDLVYLC